MIKTLERCQRLRFGVFIADLEHISITPFFWCLLLTLNNYLLAEIELLMCNCNKNCLKRTPTGPKQDVRCRSCPF